MSGWSVSGLPAAQRISGWRARVGELSGRTKAARERMVCQGIACGATDKRIGTGAWAGFRAAVCRPGPQQ
jgi:hypothetical protein